MATKEDIQISKKGQYIARHLDSFLRRITGKRMGFVLIAFSFDAEDHRPNYMSNCEREQMKGAMRDLLRHWDEGMPDVPAHKVQ